MKKLLFCAIAIVAISSASIANTVAVKETKFKVETNSNEEFQIVKHLEVSCDDEQRAAEQECLSNGCTVWEAYYFGAKAWGDCMAER